jgi:DNA polymerase bacteriophage-type
VQAVLELRQDGGGSSSSKAGAIRRQISADGRVRGPLIYGGAPATLRWSSHGAQLHNLPRHDPRFDPQQILRDISVDATLTELEDLHGPPLKLVSEMLRPVLIAAPGKVLVTADYAQIEARVLAWLAGQEDRLDVFRAFDAGAGPDPYRVTASRIYRTDPSEITASQRQIGKVADLALGYQGGSRAFKSMAKNFGLKIPTAQAEEIKHAWRAAHPHIEHFWWRLDDAARECLIQSPGATFNVGKLQFKRSEHAMRLRLPSGRSLIYWYPSLKEAETPWGELRIQPHYYGQDAVTRQWVEFKAYGGLLAENVTQATARDLLADALVRLDAAGLNPVLTIHDEVICETEAANARAVTDILLTLPAWADGLPVAVDTTAAIRYMKGAS